MAGERKEAVAAGTESDDQAEGPSMRWRRGAEMGDMGAMAAGSHAFE